MHDYAGIILPTYATLAPMTPFIIPVHLGTLNVPMGSTQYFSEYQLVQCALIQQVLEAIDSKYLTRMINRVTGQVPSDIQLLVMSLFTIYGKILAYKLKEKYDAVATMPYEIVEPIDTIFDAVDDLREIAELANRPYTATQMVDLGYIVVSQPPPSFDQMCNVGFARIQPTRGE